MMLGVGLGYRPHFHRDILANLASLDFVEVIIDSFQRNLDALRVLASLIPVTTHSLALSIGTETDPTYEEAVNQTRRTARSPWHSDHLAFTTAAGLQAPHFVPIVYDDTSLTHVCNRIRKLQKSLEVPLALENISAPFQWPNNTMQEPQFLTEMVNRTQCRLLLDVENLRINSHNHGYRPREYMDALPSDSVTEIHIAGGTVNADLHVDSHDQAVPEATWGLLEDALHRFPTASVLLEHDGPAPSFQLLLDQVERARKTREAAT